MAKRRNPYKGASVRKNTVVKKAHELGQLPGFEVALFIRRRGRVTSYRSIDDETWWPVKAEIDFAYPMPTNLVTHHFEVEQHVLVQYDGLDTSFPSKRYYLVDHQ